MSVPLRTPSTPALAVWTDFGGVLTQPVDVTFAEFSARYGVPLHALKEAMRLVGEAHGTDSMGVIDIPLLDEDAWSKELEEELERTFGLVCDLSDFGDRWFAGRPGNRAWAAHLASFRERGAFVGLLSNLPPSWERHRALLADDSHFDDVVCSHRVGARKPEPEIFRLAARRAGVEPRACVLVDDMDKNIAGARAAGWQAVHFRDADQAAFEVGRLLDLALQPAVRALSA
ncbi:HAD-IA family hydrolase [Streptacidiphilus albus]|uniref:HAD-IA family hydrolase n=1 Tax=Streptacidiphilus albus TaxID=105425 RepID=UPI0007C641B4|nr:HAD-IA family hydrolase [Streptacidiphilus albus]